MLSPAKVARLAALIDSLPDDAARNLEAVIQQGRGFDGRARDLVAAALLERTARIREARRLTSETLERAPIAIAKALPFARFGSFGATRVADFCKAASDEVVEAALSASRLIVSLSSGESADALAIGEAVRAESLAHLTSYTDALLAELRVNEPSRRAVVERQFGVAVSLTAILLGADAAKQLRARRAGITALEARA